MSCTLCRYSKGENKIHLVHYTSFYHFILLPPRIFLLFSCHSPYSSWHKIVKSNIDLLVGSVWFTATCWTFSFIRITHTIKHTRNNTHVNWNCPCCNYAPSFPFETHYTVACTPFQKKEEKMHWLPITECIKSKVACVCFHAINASDVSCRFRLLHVYIPSRTLRSSSDFRIVSRSENTNARHAASSFYFPTLDLWNSPPPLPPPPFPRPFFLSFFLSLSPRHC